ncbi:hypothetical protein J2Y48_003681 [Mycoplana sp. BE70]|nr:hypothetical protein [Mycoplana sp. BE70]
MASGVRSDATPAGRTGMSPRGEVLIVDGRPCLCMTTAPEIGAKCKCVYFALLYEQHGKGYCCSTRGGRHTMKRLVPVCGPTICVEFNMVAVFI